MRTQARRPWDFGLCRVVLSKGTSPKGPATNAGRIAEKGLSLCDACPGSGSLSGSALTAVAVDLAVGPCGHMVSLHRTALIRAQISSCPEWDKCVTEYPSAS